MKSLKQLKMILLGIFLVGFTITGTYVASESSLSSRHRRSPGEQTDDASSPPLVREGKESSDLDSRRFLSNPQSANGSVQANLHQINESNSDANAVNSSTIANNASSVNVTNPSPNIDLNTTSMMTPTSPNQIASSPKTTSPATTAATSSPATTLAMSATTKITNPTTRSMTISSAIPSKASTSTDQLFNQTSSTISSNSSLVANETLHERIPGKGGLTPTLAAIVGLGCGLVFFVMIYAVFRLVKNFKTFRFRRLHEMPMDDFDDYSGVYVEHTVPIRG